MAEASMTGRSADETALLRAVWAAPNDDAPRLVYADWLDEQGESERAEFIRLQCDLARIDPADERYLKLSKTEARLWQKHRAKWSRGLPKDAHAFHRGFPVAGPFAVPVRRVTGQPLDDWDFAPAVGLSLYGSLSRIDALADWPGLERVGTLQLKGARATGTKLARFLASPRLRNLSGLEFMQVPDLGEAGVRAVVESPVWPRLTRLSFRYCRLGGPAVRAVAGARPAPDLADLQFNDPMIRAGDAKALAASPVLSPVRRLSLSGTWIDSSDVIALASSPHLSAVRWLDLKFVGSVSGRAVKRLAHAPALTRLCSLSLGILTEPDAAAAFLASPVMSHLRELRIVYAAQAKMSPTVARKLRARFGREAVFKAPV